MKRVAVALVTALVVVTGAAPATSATRWKPRPGLRWQYQLQGNVNVGIVCRHAVGGPCVHPDVFDIDLYAAATARRSTRPR